MTTTEASAHLLRTAQQQRPGKRPSPTLPNAFLPSTTSLTMPLPAQKLLHLSACVEGHRVPPWDQPQDAGHSLPAQLVSPCRCARADPCPGACVGIMRVHSRLSVLVCACACAWVWPGKHVGE